MVLVNMLILGIHPSARVDDIDRRSAEGEGWAGLHECPLSQRALCRIERHRRFHWQ